MFCIIFINILQTVIVIYVGVLDKYCRAVPFVVLRIEIFTDIKLLWLEIVVFYKIYQYNYKCQETKLNRDIRYFYDMYIDNK